jgi:hypothetical protein
MVAVWNKRLDKNACSQILVYFDLALHLPLQPNHEPPSRWHLNQFFQFDKHQLLKSGIQRDILPAEE